MSFFSGLFHRFRGAFDPNRVAMSRAFLAGDYGAAAEQFRQLQAEHERLRTWDRKKRKADAAFDSDGYAALEDSLKPKLDAFTGRPLEDDLIYPAGHGDYGAMQPPAFTPAHQRSAFPDQSPAHPPLRDDYVQDDAVSPWKGPGMPMPPTAAVALQAGVARGQQPRTGDVTTGVGAKVSGELRPGGDRQSPVLDPLLDAARQYPEKALARFKGINGYGYNPRQSDENLLARALFAEGSNVPQDMEALAAAIVNRIRPGGRVSGRTEVASTLQGVLDNGPAFSFMPNRGRNGPDGSDQWVLSGQPERMTALERRSWKMARRIAARMLGGKYSDPTGGATFFFHSPHYQREYPRTAPDEFFQTRIRDGRLRLSPYISPYPRRPGDRRAPWPSYFFRHEGDFPPKG
jgi:hypothetical protein